MKEHYYIIKWSKAGGWELDSDTEEARFPNGTVWNGSEWEYPYEGDGVFNDNNDLVSQDLSAMLNQANERQGRALMTDDSISWGELAELTHATQVERFNFCLCEEQEQFPYEDCPRQEITPEIDDLIKMKEEEEGNE